MMLTDVVNTVQSWIWVAGDTKCEPSTTDQKVSLVGRVLQSLKTERYEKKENVLTFSLLRLLWWASLLYNARAQQTDPFPAQFDLSRLDGTNGFVIHGEEANGYCGISVACLSDVNGDQIDDIIVGAIRANPMGKTEAGRTYLIFGRKGLGNQGSIDLKSLNHTNGLVIDGARAGDRSGIYVFSAEDVNNDGFNDILIGAAQASPSGRSKAGSTYVVFGSKDLLGTNKLDLLSLNGSNGFVINGEQMDEKSGWSVSSAGDINGDGNADILIGTRNGSPMGKPDAGKTYLVFGKKEVGNQRALEISSLDGINGVVINGENAGDNCGWSVGSSGDVNSDGLDDILIGAYHASPFGVENAGKAYLLFGNKNFGTNTSLNLSSLNGINGFSINCVQKEDRCGSFVSTAGDLNGDGVIDFIIGADHSTHLGSERVGKCFILFGRKSLGKDGLTTLTSLNGTYGFMIIGEELGDEFSKSISNAGDVNGDGIDDMIIASYLASPDEKFEAGKVYVIFGDNKIGMDGIFELSSLNGSNGFVINGESEYDHLGRFVSGGKDVNSDGISDIIMGASNASISNRPQAGKSYVIFGRKISQFSDNSNHFRNSASTQDMLINSQTLGKVVSSHLISNPTMIISTLSESDTTPLYIGITLSIVGICVSVFAGGYFFWMQKERVEENKVRTNVENGDPLEGYVSIESIQRGMQSPRDHYPQNANQADGEYDIIQINHPSGDYNKWPSKPPPNKGEHYTSIDKVEQQHDQYAEAKFKEAHENYDDVNV